MAARIGRKVALTVNALAVAGVQEKGIAMNGEVIDVSDGASDGWRELLTEAGESTVEISLSGVTKDTALKTLWFDDPTDRSAAIVLTYPDTSAIAGTFILATYSEAEPYKGAATFEATLQSSGEVTYTPA